MNGGITIRMNILTNFLLVVFGVSIALIGVQYYFAKRTAGGATHAEFRQIASRITATIHANDTLAKTTLELLEGYSNPKMTDEITLLQQLSIPMRQNTAVYAVYAGNKEGDLFEVVNLECHSETAAYFKAPALARWLAITVKETAKGRYRNQVFYDHNFTRLEMRRARSTYRATDQLWYQQALGARSSVRSDAYLFSSLQQYGITFSKALKDGSGVIALDVTLHTLQHHFADFKFSPNSVIALLDRSGNVMVSSEKNRTPADAELEKAFKNREVGSMIAFELEDEAWLGMILPLSTEVNSTTWMAFAVDEAAMLKPYLSGVKSEIMIALLVFLLSLPLVGYSTRHIVRPIELFTVQTENIKARRFDAVQPVQTNIIELEALSESLTSMAKNIRAYQQSQKEMMDAFIKVIAEAIDAKSAYTGGHCRRVPVIAMMLAREAEVQKEGPFADFALGDAEAWEEFERGTWLHDCGKITTPEYVVDKATKLETIYNRIHEVRTRFEVLWRDVQIEYFTRLVGGEDQAELEGWLWTEHEKLLKDFKFIASANLGGEFMSEEHQQRIREIGSRTWVRHFDDRLGLSESELLRYEGVPEHPAPYAEKLLDDKPEHKIARENFDEAAYRAQRFKTPVPELLYDYGELYNLCLEKGTLTDEERFKINEHVIMSIKMLEQMPLPENMKRIPYYAGTHHETLNGIGYPRQLSAEELDVQARITAIADIFEALTASDRPYKKAKTVSESLKIMSFMVKEEHIDAELFTLFLRSGVYMEYAKAYLKPEQIDAVDIEEYL